MSTDRVLAEAKRPDGEACCIPDCSAPVQIVTCAGMTSTGMLVTAGFCLKHASQIACDIESALHSVYKEGTNK